MVIMRIPARRLLIFRRVLRIPVRHPATKPQITEMRILTKGETPSTIKRAATAPPRAKLPSTVRSGKANIRKLITMPNATRA